MQNLKQIHEAAKTIRKEAAARWLCLEKEIYYPACLSMAFRGEKLGMQKTEPLAFCCTATEKSKNITINVELFNNIDIYGKNAMVVKINGNAEKGSYLKFTQKGTGVELSKDLSKKIFGLDKQCVVLLDLTKQQWHDLQDRFAQNAKHIFEEKQAEKRADAERVEISKVFLTHNRNFFIEKTEPDCVNVHLRNDVSVALEAINKVDFYEFNDEELKSLQTSCDYDDYSITNRYEITLKKLLELGLKAKKIVTEKRAAAEKKHAEVEQKRANYLSEFGLKFGSGKKQVNEIRFYCESAPHKIDLSKEILNSPCGQGGHFTTSDLIEIEKSAWEAIKSAGHCAYWDREFLEDCDFFNAYPGWRYTIEALKLLESKGYIITVT